MANSITKQGTTEPFELQVSKGDIGYHTTYFRQGSISSQDTTEAIINSAGYIPAYQTAAGVVKISSGSINDDLGGTGCETALITGIDANNAIISETVTMDGQTEVLTTLSYLRVTNIQPLTFGAGGVSDGIIYAGTGTVTTGVPATVYLRCAAGASAAADLGAYEAITANKSLYITGVNLTAGVSSNTATLLLKSRAMTSATWTTLHSFVTTVNASTYPTFQYPLYIPAGSEYCVTSDASATTISASANVYGILISE